MNLATNLERSAFFFPNRPAVCENGSEISYAQLNEQANRVATALLKMGVKAGDHLGLCAPNSSAWLVFYFGVLKAGACAVTLSSLLSPDEFRLLVSHAKLKFLFTSEARLGTLQDLRGPGGIEKVICPNGDLTLQQIIDAGIPSFEAIDRDRTNTAAILYTGGTTGVPKGVMLTHENINVSAHNVAFSERSTEKDRALCFLPFNHVFGQMHITNATILSAGCLEILPAFDMGRVLEAIDAGLVTKLFAVPTVYARFLTLERLEEMMRNVRYCFSAAASLPTEIVRKWKERTGLNICEGYGLTESASAVTYNHYYRHVVGSIGTTVPGVEVQIRDTSGNILERGQQGEICIQGHNIMRGYLDNPEATADAFWRLDTKLKRHEDGWFRSGDLGYFDDEDYLYIIDRLKELIITGGENVYPREVEEVIYTRPEIEECAVVGLPDKEWGERVAVFLLPKSGQEIAPEDLKSYLKSRLSSFKVPKQYIVMNEMPKSPAGKILKRELKKKFIDGNG
jgi:long-chain acyl-CoA synthetase